MRFKEFKLAAVSSNTSSFGMHNHVFMARDGEAWDIQRFRFPHIPRIPEKGDIVQVPMNGDVVLERGWHTLYQDEILVTPREPAPKKVADEVWNTVPATKGSA